MLNTPFPQDAWYALAWQEEAGRKLSHRKVCGHDIVFYRTRAGKVAALADVCWHRLVPLSKGQLDGDTVVCPYHGLKYEPGGRCVHMPSQDTINPSASVRAFPVEERHRLVWIWPGDPKLADPALIPDMSRLDHPDWAGDGTHIHAQCNFQLVLDNLMDLTHETFVHAGSIGNEAVAEAPFDVSHGERRAKVTRWMIDSVPANFWAAQLPGVPRVDRWQIIHFTAPSTIQIDVGVAPTGTGAPEGDRSQGRNAWVINTITPETDSTCHYFWAFVRNFDTTNQSTTNAHRDGVRHVFRQDEEILAQQQRAMEAYPDKTFYNLNIDAGAMWARRINQQMLDEEEARHRSLRAVG